MDLMSLVLTICTVIGFLVGGLLLRFAFKGLGQKKYTPPKPDQLTRQIDRMRKNTPGDIPIFNKNSTSIHIPIKRVKRHPLASDWENSS